MDRQTRTQKAGHSPSAGKQTLQPGVLFFKHLQPPDLGHRHARKRRLPTMERALGHAVLATETGKLRARLMLLLVPDDMLFGSNCSLDCPSLSWGGLPSQMEEKSRSRSVTEPEPVQRRPTEERCTHRPWWAASSAESSSIVRSARLAIRSRTHPDTSVSLPRPGLARRFGPRAPVSRLSRTMSLTKSLHTRGRLAAAVWGLPSSTRDTARSRSATGCGLPDAIPICLNGGDHDCPEMGIPNPVTPDTL